MCTFVSGVFGSVGSLCVFFVFTCHVFAICLSHLFVTIVLEVNHRHCSHFGSRYTLGCCACAGLLARGSILADCTFGRKQEVDRTAENNIAIFVEVFCFEGLTANPPSSIMDFGGFYSIIILMLRLGIPRPACREFP